MFNTARDSEATQYCGWIGVGLAIVGSLVSPAGPEATVDEIGEDGNLVYQCVNSAGRVNYVGITNNFERRAAEHLSTKGIAIRAIRGLQNLSRADARAVEQALIEFHGLSRDGGSLMNKYNSIAGSRQIYVASLERGIELLRLAGYPGF